MKVPLLWKKIKIQIIRFDNSAINAEIVIITCLKNIESNAKLHRVPKFENLQYNIIIKIDIFR